MGREELGAHLLGEFFVIDRGLGPDAERRQLLEDPVKAVVLRGRGLPRLAVAAPQNGNAIGLVFGSDHRYAPRLARGAELGRQPSDGVPASTPLQSYGVPISLTMPSRVAPGGGYRE